MVEERREAESVLESRSRAGAGGRSERRSARRAREGGKQERDSQVEALEGSTSACIESKNKRDMSMFLRDSMENESTPWPFDRSGPLRKTGVAGGCSSSPGTPANPAKRGVGMSRLMRSCLTLSGAPCARVECA